MRLSKNIFVLLLILIFPNHAFAVVLNSQDVIPHSINELPFYGNVKKTAEMQKTDEEFIVSATKIAGTAEKASYDISAKSWSAFKNMQLNEAMKRANQAWLLDNKNHRVYWVMAFIQTFRGAKREEVDNLFKQALSRVTSKDKERLEYDYESFTNNKLELFVENIIQITEEYQQAQTKLLGK